MTNPFAMDTPAPAGNTATATLAPLAQPAAPVSPAPAAPQGDPFAGGDPFSGPAPQQARGPRLRDLYGRLLLLVPKKLETGVPNRLGKPGDTQDRMTTDVIVLDGGPINYGGRPEATPPVAHDKVAQVPHRTADMFVSSKGLISQSRDALAKRAQGQPGMVLGRLTVGEAKEQGQSAPWLLTPPTEDDKNIARRYLASVDPFA
jgi:hypothetical protein